jgi:hypothetical protein
MNITVALLTLVLLAVVIALISAPLLGMRSGRKPESAGLADLRAAREAKYRELRDLELDYRTGKLSEADYRASDGALRAEAVELLNRIEKLEQPEAPEQPMATAATEAPKADATEG